MMDNGRKKVFKEKSSVYNAKDNIFIRGHFYVRRVKICYVVAHGSFCKAAIGIIIKYVFR